MHVTSSGARLWMTKNPFDRLTEFFTNSLS